MTLPPEFCYHTMGYMDEESRFMESLRIKEQKQEDELIEKASNVIRPLLEASGPVKFVDLIDSVKKELGFDENEPTPYGIRVAVWCSLNDGVFDMASDRTVTLRPQEVLSGKRK